MFSSNCDRLFLKYMFYIVVCCAYLNILIYTCAILLLLGIKNELCFNYVCVDSDISALKNILDWYSFCIRNVCFYSGIKLFHFS